MDTAVVLEKLDYLKIEISDLYQMIAGEIKSDKVKSFAELPVCGIWANRGEMKDSINWVNQIRKEVNKRERRLGLG